MNDADCVALLQWALPHLGLRWRGYRRVRGQVCKRIERRIRVLGLNGLAAYKVYLGEHPGEWTILDALCRIPISRFYRDRPLFDALAEHVLPELAERGAAIRCWSAGCASGEEPYTVSLVWSLCVQPRFPRTRLTIVATDADTQLLERASLACYATSSLKELPREWIDRAFDRHGENYCLRDLWKADVEFHH